MIGMDELSLCTVCTWRVTGHRSYGRIGGEFEQQDKSSMTDRLIRVRAFG